jgi:hypothetical protein
LSNTSGFIDQIDLFSRCRSGFRRNDDCIIGYARR